MTLRQGRPLLQEAMAVLTVILVVGGAYILLNWGNDSASDKPVGPSRSATVSAADSPQEAPVASPLPQESLDGLAAEVAKALADGNDQLANQIIGLGSQMTGCVLHGFTGGPVIPGKPYLEDLRDPRTQAWIRRDAAKNGADVGFGFHGKATIVVAQACPPQSGSGA